MLLAPEKTGGSAMVTMTGLTDSQVAAHVVARGMSTTYPLCCVVMELSAQLEKRGLDLELAWIPRDKNAEADALADGIVEGFSPCMRVGGDGIKSIPWLVLPELLAAGQGFHDARHKRVHPGPLPDHAARPRLAGDRLRDREPW